MKRIFAFTGKPGVGKSTVAEEFADVTDAPIVNMGEEINKHVDRSDIGVTLNTWQRAKTFREVHGIDGTAIASLSQIAAELLKSEVVIVDGIRNYGEVTTFENRFGVPVTLIKVTADYNTRLQRFYERGDYDYASMSVPAQRCLAESDMNDRTSREIDVGLKGAIEQAPYEIDNSGSLEKSRKQCLQIAEKFDI